MLVSVYKTSTACRLWGPRQTPLTKRLSPNNESDFHPITAATAGVRAPAIMILGVPFPPYPIAFFFGFGVLRRHKGSSNDPQQSIFFRKNIQPCMNPVRHLTNNSKTQTMSFWNCTIFKRHESHISKRVQPLSTLPSNRDFCQHDQQLIDLPNTSRHRQVRPLRRSFRFSYRRDYTLDCAPYCINTGTIGRTAPFLKAITIWSCACCYG